MKEFLRHLRTAMMVLAIAFALFVFLPTGMKTAALQATGSIRIYGAVNSPLNLTYDQLLSFPMVSEVARIKCVLPPPDTVYNWTGVPLFHLLTLTQIKPEAYKVVTKGSDGFSSDLLIEDALRPTTILALEANGTSLPQLANGPAGPYRLVVPGKYGYKWVAGITEIEVVTTDYLGTYESGGVWTDDASVPDYGPMPTPTPPIQTFTLPYGNRTFEVDAFTNVSVMALTFDPLQKALDVNVTVPQGTSGFADFKLQHSFLVGPYNITLDEKTIVTVEADVNNSSYLYMPLDEGFHTAGIFGTEFFGHVPEILVNYNTTTYVGQNVTLDASRSVDYGRIVSYEWNFGDGTTGNGVFVTHSYDKQGTYQIMLNVTNDEGISNLATLTILVESPSNYIYVKVFLATVAALLIVMFAFLLKNRRKEHLDEPQESNS